MKERIEGSPNSELTTKQEIYNEPHEVHVDAFKGFIQENQKRHGINAHLYPPENIIRTELYLKSRTSDKLRTKFFYELLRAWDALAFDRYLRQLVRDELAAFGNRLVFFLMRIAFAAEQTRILVTNILDRMLKKDGVEPKVFNSLVDQSSRMARRNIIARTPQIKSLLEEWEESNTSEEEKAGGGKENNLTDGDW